MHESTHIPGAGNGSQADHKRNNNAIQTPKLSQYRARGAGKSNRINVLESNSPQDSLYLNELISASSCICELCHLYRVIGVVSSCTGTQRNPTLTNCATTPCMDMKTIGIPPCTGTPGQPRNWATWMVLDPWDQV